MKYRDALIYLLLFISVIYGEAQIDSAIIKNVDSLLLVSFNSTNKHDFDQALEVNAVAEKIVLEKYGHISPTYARVCIDHGRIMYIKSNYLEAEKWYLEAKVILEKTLGKDDLKYAKCENNLANVYNMLGKYEIAEPYYLDVIAIRSKLLGTKHPDYASSLGNLAVLYNYMGKYEKAEPLYLEAKLIIEKVLGKEHKDYFSNLNNLAVLYYNMANYEKAEPLYIEAKSLYSKVLGKEHPDYANCVNNLAAMYNVMGSFDKAEPLYLESLSFREKTLGKDHPDYASSLNNLASLYYDMRIYEKAEPFYLEAKVIREHVLGKENPQYIESLANLANLYNEIHDYKKAEPLYLEVKAFREKVQGIENPDYANNLSNLATMYFNIRNFEKAELFYLEAIAIRKKILGEQHLDYAKSLTGLSYLYFKIGNFEKAESLCLEVKSIFEKANLKDHAGYTRILDYLVKLYEIQNRYSDSERFLKEISELEQTRLLKSTSYLSESELDSYNATFEVGMDNLCSYILARPRIAKSGQFGMLPDLAYDDCLFNKGFLLTAAKRLVTKSASTPKLDEIKLSLKGYRRLLAVEYSKANKEQQKIVSLEAKANDLEKELAHNLVGYKEAMRQVKWQEVQQNLKSDEAAIEFVNFWYPNKNDHDSIAYAALILLPGAIGPEFVNLFEEKSLEAILFSNSKHKVDLINGLYKFRRPDSNLLEKSDRSLYEIIWRPIESRLKGINKIYFSPSGLLHRVNLNAIPVSEIKTLSDQYLMIELKSTRQLVMPNEIRNGNKDAVLYGGIQYEQDSSWDMPEPLVASRSRGNLSFSLVDSTLRGGIWNYLPGTDREVNTLGKIMQTAGINVIIKKSYDASEESFKNIGSNESNSPNILHIATHGYFFPDPKINRSDDISSIQNEPVFKLSDHPMLRSGLILAGGNAAWRGKSVQEGKEDGILTAYEISQMNLSNTELVVLSACETGLGDIHGHEGVYGLQRAFKIAGVKFIIMSLWQVPDKKTSLLMTTFYKKWLQEKMPIPQAFHSAQNELRVQGLDPYQWAGFVLME